MIFISFQVRDYIHVVDLADGHIAALQKLSDAKVGMCCDHSTVLSSVIFSLNSFLCMLVSFLH